MLGTHLQVRDIARGNNRRVLSFILLIVILFVTTPLTHAQPMSGLGGLPGRNPYRDRMTYTAPHTLVRQEVEGGKSALKILQLAPPASGAATAGLLAMEAADRNPGGFFWALAEYSLVKAASGAFHALRVCGGGNLKNTGDLATGVAAKVDDVLYHTTKEGTIARVLADNSGSPTMRFFHKQFGWESEWGIYFNKINPAKDWVPRAVRTLSLAAGGTETIVFTGSAASLARKHPFRLGSFWKSWEDAWIIPFHNVRILKYSYDAANKTLYVYEAELVKAQVPRWGMAIGFLKFNGPLDLISGFSYAAWATAVSGKNAPLRPLQATNCNQGPAPTNSDFNFSQFRSGLGVMP